MDNCILEIFGEKYVNVAKRFHYVEDKIRRKDAERLTAEKTILETLEKMNDSHEKIQKMVKSNEDAMKEFKELKISEQETETKFKETLKRFFKVEAQLLKASLRQNLAEMMMLVTQFRCWRQNFVKDIFHLQHPSLTSTKDV